MMIALRRYAAAASFTLLVACTAPSAQVSNTVLGLQKTLQLAEQTAMIYTDLPRCGSLPARGKPICSDPALAARLAEYDRKAWEAVQMAHRNEAMIGAAIEAVSAYQALIPGWKKLSSISSGIYVADDAGASIVLRNVKFDAPGFPRIEVAAGNRITIDGSR
jgi:hypothetical protein